MAASAEVTTRMPRRPFRHALVTGGSIAGLLAARVLSDYFERVTLIERDALARDPAPRKGVPQGGHLHILLVRGRLIAEALLPGITAELLAAGANLINGGRDFAWHHAGGWRARHDSDLVFLSMSRPLLESRIAARVCDLPNMTVLNGVRTIGLMSDGGGRVTGVRVARPGSRQEIEPIEADLVVDATGRGSSTPQWLAELGFAPPESELFGARVTYSTCLFRRPNHAPDWRALAVTGAPARRTGVIFPIEGDRWQVTLAGFFDEPMPQDHAAFLAFARSLATPAIYDVLRNSEPLSAIKRHRFAGSLRRHYERLTRMPEGLLVTGDAVCSFNPVYGQGMTVGAVQAEALGEALACARREGGIGPDFARRWFRRITATIDVAWDSVLIEDLRFPELTAQRPVRLRPLQWYMQRVHQATYRSTVVTDQFYRVMNFLDAPARLFHLRVMADVLFGACMGSRRDSAPDGAPLRRVPQTGEQA